MTRPRLVATDLDGTLLRTDGTVSARTSRVLEALHRARVEVLFVTARPPRWVDELAGSVAGHGLVVCANGAFVYDARRRVVVDARPLEDDLVRTVVGDLREALPGAAFAVERPAGIGSERAFDHQHPVPDGAPVAERVEDLLDGGTGKLLVTCAIPPAQLVDRIDEVLAGRALVADSGTAGMGEISAPGVTKGATLARWAAARGITAGEVWAFGDMPNDLPMLHWAGRSFAVAGAHPAVLAAVDEVCGGNDDDGVAARLESMLGETMPVRG